MHPHSLFFFQKKKRECAVHGGREKKKYVPAGGRGTGDALGVPPFFRKSSGRGVVRAGVLAPVEWTGSSFRCRWYGRNV